MTEIYFSVDIEADGPFPADGFGYSMSSFGAVACAVMDNDGTIHRLDVDDTSNYFYAELAPISNNVVPEAAAVSGLDRQHLIENGEDPFIAMRRFNAWVTVVAASQSAIPVFVAWPAPFDWFWMYWYLMRFAGESAFGFSGAINMKDWYAAKNGLPSKKVGKRKVYAALGIKPRPHTHNALDDAIEQAELWQTILLTDRKSY